MLFWSVLIDLNFQKVLLFTEFPLTKKINEIYLAIKNLRGERTPGFYPGLLQEGSLIQENIFPFHGG